MLRPRASAEERAPFCFSFFGASREGIKLAASRLLASVFIRGGITVASFIATSRRPVGAMYTSTCNLRAASFFLWTPSRNGYAGCLRFYDTYTYQYEYYGAFCFLVCKYNYKCISYIHVFGDIG